MARLVGIEFTGSLGDFSAYRMSGSDKITLRKKGGASKEKIKTSPKFANTRRNMAEFGGCSTMGKQVRLMMGTVKTLADYNISGHINKFLKVVQKQDMVNAWGQRAILLSEHPHLLEGFSLNKQRAPFDSVIRNTINFSLARETRSARIDIPALLRDINFFPQNRHPLFRITVSLGIVPDFTFNEATERFEPPVWYGSGLAPQEVSTPWYPALEGSPATTLEVALKDIPADGAYSLMLSIGISFGTLYKGGLIEPVKHTGSAKVLALQGRGASGLSAADGGTKKDTKPVEKVIVGPTMSRKDNMMEGRTPEGNTATVTGTVQYVYTVRHNTEVKQTNTHVYTYTIERNESEKQEGRGWINGC